LKVNGFVGVWEGVVSGEYPVPSIECDEVSLAKADSFIGVT
jgi:hypothetical protein